VAWGREVNATPPAIAVLGDERRGETSKRDVVVERSARPENAGRLATAVKPGLDLHFVIKRGTRIPQPPGGTSFGASWGNPGGIVLGRGERCTSGAGVGISTTTSGAGASDGVGGRTTSGCGVGIGSFAIAVAPHVSSGGNAGVTVSFRPAPTPLPFSAMKLAARGVSKIHLVLVGEDLCGSPRQPLSHVMIVVVIVVVVVMMVVMVVVVMVVVVLLGECRERREAKCGAEC
jgi:hypothetical protein